MLHFKSQLHRYKTENIWYGKKLWEVIKLNLKSNHKLNMNSLEQVLLKKPRDLGEGMGTV